MGIWSGDLSMWEEEVGNLAIITVGPMCAPVVREGASRCVSTHQHL